MPSLVAFGRRWNIASDDFVFPEITEAIFRASWIIIGVLVFIAHYPSSCSVKDINVPVLILIVINGFSFVLAFATAIVSARGTIMHTRPRRHVATLLYLRVPVLVAETAWTLYSTIQVFGNSLESESACQVSVMMKISVVLEWILLLIVFIGVVIVFHPKHDEEDLVAMSGRTWSRRFGIFKIRQDAIMRAAIDDLANLVASFFVDRDFVLSDVVAGLLLIVHSPKNELPPLVDENIDSSPPAWMNVKDALHFFHFATTIYGWPTYLCENFRPSTFVKLIRGLRCCGSMQCGKHQVTIVQDNCCFCNTAALLQWTDKEKRNIDIVFVSFKNNVYQVPFVALADHDSKSIVVAIRGTSSMTDLITDLCLSEDVLSLDVSDSELVMEDPSVSIGSRSEVRVHRGMLLSARYVYDTLKGQDIIEGMRISNPDYNLVICGHSLGAGVASCLTMLMKNEYPQVRCYSYAPPGCVISEEGLGEMRKYVMSIVCGDDIISRLSYQSLFRLRENVDKEIRKCQLAKCSLLVKGAYRCFVKEPWQVPVATNSPSPDEDFERLMDSGTGSAARTGTSYSPAYGAVQPLDRAMWGCPCRIQLYVPGRTLYVSEDNGSTKSKWIDPTCLTDVKLSSSAILDHIPRSVIRILKAVDEALDREGSTSSQRTSISSSSSNSSAAMC